MAQALKPHFKIGHKPIYLPNFVICFMRTPSLPPTFAKFKVPYSFNKLDLRDYLFHAYGVRALSVRSFIKYVPVRQDKPNKLRPMPRRWFRPRGKKFMTVEMDKPFVWPEKPTDFEVYEKELYDAANKTSSQQQRNRSPISRTFWPSDRETIAEQARSLLDGTTQWKPQPSK